MPDDTSRPPGPQDPRIPRAEPVGEARPAQLPPYVYGYPQQQSQPPQQPQPPQPPPPGYGYPPPQQMPQQPTISYPLPGAVPPQFAPQHSEPDWARLAEQEESRGKRKRTLVIVGSVTALTVACGGIAFGAIKLSHKSPTVPVASHSAAPTPVATATATATPSASHSSGHQAALHANAVLNKGNLQIDGQSFDRKATETTVPCWKGTAGGLGSLLKGGVCEQVLRATYVSGKSAVTVGIGVFHTAAEAKAADDAFRGTVEPLYGKGISSFCKDPAPCAITHAVHGRFLYMTIAGSATGTPAKGSKPTSDSTAAGRGVSDYALTAVLKLDQSDD